MREPAVAGMFYPASHRGLLKELRKCFRNGPGREKEGEGPRVRGLISPHAGYTYSGPTAAYGFLAAADGGLPDTVIILGPNHTGLGSEIGVSLDDMRTPLGIMENDRELSEKMKRYHDELSHMREHSMEVQIPFIQFFSEKVKQVCISLGHPGHGLGKEGKDRALMEQADEVSTFVLDAIQATGKDVLVVASSDFTHCGYNYGYPVPPDMNAGEFARTRDLPVIESLVAGDLESTLNKKRELGTTACGMGPILSMIKIMKKTGYDEIRLLDYTTSYDISPSHSAVGYASIAVF